MKILLVLGLISFLSWSEEMPHGLIKEINAQSQINNRESVKNQNWRLLVSGISRGEPEWLRTIPQFAAQLSTEQRHEIMNALGNALIHNPVDTLNILPDISKTLDGSGIDLYRWDYLCVGLVMDYTRESAYRYYATAMEALKQSGEQGRECLTLMQEGLNEIEQDERRGKVHWGHKIWP
ncbi:hypothetical protein [Nissabacter sp. SGAir0207]|uniref:hypothetical protein n=1 Tax=Nissabacter sp. SGAir0207 TaxID=2126321 RepID=UPI0010CCEC86|nr:hypothetical protein [Nissabacter sp. SGAir0207]QCR35817.1 hypothetical protein C1N62_06815 [Nissabacter sp. SGAir0207]